MKILKLFAALLCISRLAFAQCDLVTNGSFEAGNTGFGTDLNFSPGFNFGTYNLVGNAQTADPDLDNVSSQDGSLFMVVDGRLFNPGSIWNQTVDVCEGSVYTFCFWYADIHDGYAIPPSFNVTINGVQINAAPIVANNNTWAQYCGTWTATSTTAYISIDQNVFLFGGNDFGIDNISFNGICDCSQQFCMYIEKLNDRDLGRNVEATADGGFIAVGDIHQNAGDKDIYVVKYNADMSVAFAKRMGDYGSPAVIYQENGYSVLPTEDSYYILATAKSASGNHDIAIFKLDLAGNLLWSQRYGAQGSNRDEFGTKLVRAVLPTGTRYYAVGYTNSFSTTIADHNMFIMNFSPTNGFPECTQTYMYGLTGSSERAYDAIVDNTNSFIILTGETISPAGNRDMYSIKASIANLSFASSLILMGTGTEVANGVAQTNDDDDHIFLAGRTTSIGSNDAIYLVKVNLGTFNVTPGNARGYTSTSPNIQEFAYGITESNDNNLLVVGSNRFNHSFLMKVDQSLNVLFSKTTTYDSNNDVFFSVAEELDGEIVQTGSYGVSAADDDIFISRANASGESCCNTDILYSQFSLLSQDTKHDRKNVCFLKYEWGILSDYHDENFLCTLNEGKIVSDPVEFQSTYGSKLMNSQLELSAVPNPSDGSFKLAANQDINQIDVYDLSGKNVKSFRNINKSDVNLNLSELENGVYILHVNSNNFSEKMRIVIHK